LLVWLRPQQLQVESIKCKTILDGSLDYKDAHHIESILELELDVNLAETLADIIIKNLRLILKIDSLHQ
jgi:hypothetical protein